jgi:translation elongation factor EF-Tu-like GTPase
MTELIKIKARLKLYEGKEMRQSPFVSKYRPIFDFPGAQTKLSGSIDLLDREAFHPGTSAIVEVSFIKGMVSEKFFTKGQSFTISEGGKNDLGHGEVLERV